MHIAQIVKVSLTGKAVDELSYGAYTATQEWLNQWTPRGSMKAVVGKDRDECLAMLREDLNKSLVSSWLKSKGVLPKHFKFQISDQEVKEGRFWMPSGVVCGTDFYVEE